MSRTPPPANYDEAKVGAYTLPDPLRFENGAPVRSAEEWTERRRPEIRALFETHVYGRSPAPPPDRLPFDWFDADDRALGGTAIRRQATIFFSPDRQGPKQDLLLYLPARATGPVPVILALNFRGNHAVIADPGVRLAAVWDGETGTPQTAPEASRGADPQFDVAKILARGYGFATVHYGDIEPDFDGGYAHGIRPRFLRPGQNEPAPDEWGAIGAWAYGLSRALDFLETVEEVDARRVAVMGHSRLGKTALWAAAQDERFALVLSSCPGEGGASLMRRDYGETIAHLAHVFPYWFCARFREYAGRADRLPVDAHELIALIAPRPVYVTGAEDDQWADPTGQFLACVAAGPVYRLLGAPDLGADRMPPLDRPVHGTIGYHYRTGVHAVTAFDWDQFLAFADIHLR